MQSNDVPQLGSVQAGEEGSLGMVSTVVHSLPQSELPEIVRRFTGDQLRSKFELLRKLSEDAQISKIKKRIIEYSMLRELEMKVRAIPGFDSLQPDQKRV
jgi:hypothetical protein